jgi:predicted transcriptional regulator
VKGQKRLFNTESRADLKGSYYVIKLTNEVAYPSDTVNGFRDLVHESSDLYPGIEVWFDKKVIPGVKDGSRYAYLVMHQGKPVAEAIIKRGNDTKLCSMRIKPAYQNKAIGPILFAQIAYLLEKETSRVHFTAPESLIEEREGLFNALGFANIGRAQKQYRFGQDELVYRADSVTFRRRALRWLTDSQEGDASLRDGLHSLVMSIHPKYAFMIVNNLKTVEVRSRFSNRHAGKTVFLYATKPSGSIVGEAKVASVVEGKPVEIWSLYEHQIGCTKREFDTYCVGLRRVSAVILEEVFPYPDPLPWQVFSAAFDAPVKPPQSYSLLKPSGFVLSDKFKREVPLLATTREGEQIALF